MRVPSRLRGDPFVADSIGSIGKEMCDRNVRLAVHVRLSFRLRYLRNAK